jgi:hypothetical protein
MPQAHALPNVGSPPIMIQPTVLGRRDDEQALAQPAQPDDLADHQPDIAKLAAVQVPGGQISAA